MNIGIVGSSPLAALVAARLKDRHAVHVLAGGAIDRAGVGQASALSGLAQVADVLIVCAASPDEARALLLDPAGLRAGLSAGKAVIDQTNADPDTARALAEAVRQTGADYLDAPVYCEHLAAWPDASVVLCGGSAETMATARPVLEDLGAKVIHAGDTGSGQTARLVVAVAAASNRLVTGECAAMGYRNGLSVADMGTVLTRCSGYSSATARVLPAIATGGQTADVTLGSVVDDLGRATQLAMAVGAPLLVGNVVAGLLQAAAIDFGDDAGLDATFGLFKTAAGATDLASS